MEKPRDIIISLPHPDLRKRSQKIGIVTDEINDLVNSMCDATIDWENSREHEVGVALASVQVDKLYRLVIIRDDFDDKKNKSFTVFINPEITKKYGEIEEDYEGCLSIKDVYGKVPRYTKVKVKALDLNGNEFRISAEGFLARVFQHEIDHTNGIVFVDHIKENSDAFFKIDSKGHLKKLDYEKLIKSSRILW